MYYLTIDNNGFVTDYSSEQTNSNQIASADFDPEKQNFYRYENGELTFDEKKYKLHINKDMIYLSLDEDGYLQSAYKVGPTILVRDEVPRLKSIEEFDLSENRITAHKWNGETLVFDEEKYAQILAEEEAARLAEEERQRNYRSPSQRIGELEGRSEDLEGQVIEISDAICDLDMAQEERLSAIESALCDLDILLSE